MVDHLVEDAQKSPEINEYSKDSYEYLINIYMHIRFFFTTNTTTEVQLNIRLLHWTKVKSPNFWPTVL